MQEFFDFLDKYKDEAFATAKALTVIADTVGLDDEKTKTVLDTINRLDNAANSIEMFLKNETPKPVVIRKSDLQEAVKSAVDLALKERGL